MQNSILMGLKIWRSWKPIGSETNRILRAVWGPAPCRGFHDDNNMVYSLGIYLRGICTEQNSYGFKNLEKLETNRIRNQ